MKWMFCGMSKHTQLPNKHQNAYQRQVYLSLVPFHYLYSFFKLLSVSVNYTEADTMFL